MWGRKKKEKEKDKDKIVREIIEGSKKKGFIFPPFLEDVYSIADWMADFTDGERRPYCRELRLVLEPSDWCKFQEQPFYPPFLEDVYSIADWMADFTDGERRPYCRELRLVLEPSDWCKFQEQPFYQELIQYLNTVKTQKQEQALDKQRNS